MIRKQVKSKTNLRRWVVILAVLAPGCYVSWKTYSTQSNKQPSAQDKSWKVWSPEIDSPLFVNEGWECEWAKYTSQHDPTKSMNVCLHGDKDLVSRSIMHSGSWNDCHGVSQQWYHGKFRTGNTDVHVEIGANLGSCVFELLLSAPEAKILAFEPHPRNLFALTSSLKRNVELVKGRVKVYPIALGPTAGKVEMAVEKTQQATGVNFGTSFVQDYANMSTSITPFGTDGTLHQVPMERLDSIFHESPRLMKMDAQGFECKILDGMGKSAWPERVFFEVDRSLERMGCSKARLLKYFFDNGYSVFWYRAGGNLQSNLPDDDRDYNAVAILKKVG